MLWKLLRSHCVAFRTTVLNYTRAGSSAVMSSQLSSAHQVEEHSLLDLDNDSSVVAGNISNHTGPNHPLQELSKDNHAAYTIPPHFLPSPLFLPPQFHLPHQLYLSVFSTIPSTRFSTPFSKPSSAPSSPPPQSHSNKQPPPNQLLSPPFS